MEYLRANETEQELTIPLWINNEPHFTSSKFAVTSPLTNSPVWYASNSTPSTTELAISTSQKAFESWSQTHLTTRRDILLKTASILEDRIQEYAGYMRTEMGANMDVAAGFVLPIAISMLKDLAGRVGGICGSMPVCEKKGTSAMVWREPYGVTLGIVPWNAPFAFGIRSAATAIATGNTCILKASELTPRCYHLIGQSFFEAGLPAGVLNIIQVAPSDAESITRILIQHEAVMKINFTGSTGVGRKIARACGENLKPCLMELGGKNCAIVLEDADVEKAVGECIAGAFLNSGQICMSTDLIILHSKIAPEFLSTLKENLQSLPPSTVVSSTSASRLRNTILSDALSSGATIRAGNPTLPTSPTSFSPLVLANVHPSMLLRQEEIFGPLVGCITVPDEETAVKEANNTAYGLSAAVFTRDLRRGLRVARRLRTGAVHINSMTIMDEAALPFGGIKNSGWGRFNAEEGINEFLVTKTVTWDD